MYAFCRLADDIADDPTVGGDRQQLIVRMGPGTGISDPQHGRNGGAINIRIQQADTQALLGETGGQIDRHGRLADPAFGAGDHQNA